jgi:hypothetical protein
MDNQNDNEWKKLMGNLFPPSKHPHPDAFVTRVMARVSEEEVRWKFPAFVVSGALAISLLLFLPLATPLSTESLLLNDDSTDCVVIDHDGTCSENLLPFGMEDL